ncbi:MAG: hypothetical protein E7582_03600 [Ruminococcaceae bacterium]|nr:hypothetical protein [Oscillospiraceae bacterium]
MKKLRFLFVIFALILVAFGVFHTEKQKEERLIEKIVEKYNGVYLADDGNIISLYAFHGEEPFLKNLSVITDFGKECDLPVFLAIPPRKMDVLLSSLPEGFSTEPAKRLFDLAKSECKKADVNYIDLTGIFTSKSESVGDLYFATDHHWTSHGAYLAYRKIISSLGKTPLEEDFFRKEVALFNYLGSDYNKIKEKKVYDALTLYYSENYTEFTTTLVNFPYDSDLNNVTLEGMYDLKSLTSFDPYTVYFKGNNPYITIELQGEKRETLLVVRDSFASALAPFLAEHFDVILIDPRFYPTGLEALIEEKDPVAILIVENMGSFTENTIKFTY